MAYKKGGKESIRRKWSSTTYINGSGCEPHCMPSYHEMELQKTANMDLYISEYTLSELNVQNNDIDTVVKEINTIILRAAKETIRWNYKPFLSNTLKERGDATTIKALGDVYPHPSLNKHYKWNTLQRFRGQN